MEIDPTLVHEWLVRSARRNPTKEAIICDQDRWTYRKLDMVSDFLAERLVESGVRRQDRVAILLGNCPETVVCLYGTLKAGGVFVILDGNTKARRLRYVLDNCGAKVLVARADQASVVAEALGDLGRDLCVIWVGAGEQAGPCCGVHSVTWESIVGALSGADGGVYRPTKRRLPRSIDVDLAAIIYTSATTGMAKGVMCTHHNMISAARSIIAYIGNRKDDIILSGLPLSFSYGLYQVLVSCMVGATVVLERSFCYPHVTLRRMAQEKVTGFPLVPSMLAMMLRMERINEYDFSTLRYITSAGGALPVAHYRHWRRLVPQARVFNMYGLTECVRVCYLTGEELDQRPSSVGRPMPNCEVRIVDENGNEAGPGEIGELLVRGSNVMQGYWNDPELTAKVYEPGAYPASRWLHSGDVFRQDEDGFLYFVGRKDDMIKSRGERISPKEVEDVVCELEDVVEAAVVGVPDEILGQAVKVFVVSRIHDLGPKNVLRHCANRLESFMVPKYVELVTALPKTANGKINKRELLARVRE